jgi:hypothetical protein
MDYNPFSFFHRLIAVHLDQNQINFALALGNSSSSVCHLAPLEIQPPTRLMQTMGMISESEAKNTRLVSRIAELRVLLQPQPNIVLPSVSIPAGTFTLEKQKLLPFKGNFHELLGKDVC